MTRSGDYKGVHSLVANSWSLLFIHPGPPSILGWGTLTVVLLGLHICITYTWTRSCSGSVSLRIMAYDFIFETLVMVSISFHESSYIVRTGQINVLILLYES